MSAPLNFLGEFVSRRTEAVAFGGHRLDVDIERTVYRFEGGVEAWLDRFGLPEALRIGAGPAFEEIWTLRPETRDTFMQHPVPRYVRSYGVDYKYSGRNHKSAGPPPTDTLRTFRAFAEALYGAAFQQLLVNWYELETDHISKHADDEASIVSLGLGPVPRTFVVRSPRVRCPKFPVQKIALEDNVVVVMGGAFQRMLTHEVPAPASPEGRDVRRINVTLRQFVRPPPRPLPSLEKKERRTHYNSTEPHAAKKS